MGKSEDFYTFLKKIRDEPLLKWEKKFLTEIMVMEPKAKAMCPDVYILDDLTNVEENRFNAEPVKSTFKRKVNRKTKRW